MLVSIHIDMCVRVRVCMCSCVRVRRHARTYVHASVSMDAAGRERVCLISAESMCV